MKKWSFKEMNLLKGSQAPKILGKISNLTVKNSWMRRKNKNLIKNPGVKMLLWNDYYI